MRASLVPAALVLAGLPWAAPAIEFGAASGLSQRAACVAFAMTDLAARQRAGTLAPAEYRARAAALAASVKGQGGRPNAGLERRIDEMLEYIAAERPGPSEIAAWTTRCQSVFRP
ncbi:MAG: hypothetical protein DI556_04785 [Rhodovulum sulfidophilum]|uniref:Uncharacterized protein n=1 Tax=Rhodovulum sulfidophilum TaxID=35806 RepID=A0A2W5QJ28_RHOSU|nr:MAG: hypothetical protein DI556_04785 [Rhodovulum sulfidophilum]